MAINSLIEDKWGSLSLNFAENRVSQELDQVSMSVEMIAFTTN
jgi:hypothetical protein